MEQEIDLDGDEPSDVQNLDTEVVVTETGKWQPLRLTGAHIDILRFHTQGMKREDIASYCKCTPQHISNVVTSDLGQRWITEHLEALAMELRSLTPNAVDVIRDSMERDQPINHRLAGARLQMEATGIIGRERGNPAPPTPPNHLENLAERLVSLLRDKKGVTVNGQATLVQE